jgi:DNA-binding CsgD family transcriptional regulator
MMLHPEEPDQPIMYIVRQWFTFEGVRAEQGEVVIPGYAFWQDHIPPYFVLDDGYLERLTEATHVLRCPCRRLWETAEALVAHGCSGAPPAERGAGSLGDRASGTPGASLSNRDATLVRLWQDGRTSSQIGERTGESTRYVQKRIVSLRKVHGDVMVPRRREKPHRPGARAQH